MPANFFDLSIGVLDSSFYLNSTGYYVTQVHIIQALFGLILLLQIITLVLRYRSNSFWFYRLVPATGSNYRFITPNSIIMWTSLNVIYGVTIQGFLYASEKYATIGDNLTDVMLWRCLCWLPLWLGAWQMSWALFLAPILSQQNNGSGQSSILSRYPLVINTFFLIVPFLYLGSLLRFLVPLNSLFNESFQGYQVLRPLLVGASATVDAGKAFDPAVFEQIQQLAASLDTLKPEVILKWSGAFLSYSIFIGLLAAIYTVSAIRHFRSLGNAMKLIKSNLSSSRSEYSEQMAALTSSYRSLTFTSILVFLLITVFLTFNIILTVRTAEVAKGGIVAEITLLAPVYTFILLVGICTISILQVSLGSNSSNGSNTRTIGTRTATKSNLDFFKSTSQSVDTAIEMNHDFGTTMNGSLSRATIDVALVDSHEVWEKDQPHYV